MSVTCKKCRGTYWLEPHQDPTEFCDECAHIEVERLQKIVARLRKRLSKFECMKYKSINTLISRTTSPTFRAYWKEMRRHEDALRKIYGKDKLHKHVVEEVGSVHRMTPTPRRIVTFYRCALCKKDLSDAEVRKLKRLQSAPESAE